MKPKVAIVQTGEKIESSVREALGLLGGIELFVKPGQKYLLKPNLFTTKTPEEGATTDMRIVMAIASIIEELGAIPIVGECPASASYARPDIVFDGLGVRNLCRDNNVELRVLDRDHPIHVDVDGKVLGDLWFPESSLGLEGIINIPKLKTHVLTTLTCAVKNLFGLQQGGSKANHHVRVGNDPKSFSNLLLDLYSAIKHKVKLNIVDGIIGMEGDGPTTGNPVELGLIIMGDDAVAIDIVASAIIGWDPMEVGTNYLAAERGLGPKGLDEIEIVGASFDEVIKHFEQPISHQNGQMFLDVRMPILCDPKKCEGCGICSKVCPVGAIEMKQIPEFTDEKCIQCFCCIELCPEGALRVIRNVN